MKKVWIILLTGFLLFLTSQLTVNAATENNSKITITERDNALLANVGDEIDLNDYVYQHNENTLVDFDDLQLTALSDGITIDGNLIFINAKGIHRFSFEYQSTTIQVYIIAKNLVETEYVLFETGFDGVPNGALPERYQVITGSATINNEQIQLTALNGGSTIMLLPGYLRSFGNYIIEADMTIKQQDNTARWTSIMFRYEDSRYYQMAVRKYATANNGVEFAKRLTGAWDVQGTSSYTENISADKMYRLKIDVVDDTVKEYIDNQLLITYNNATELKDGYIGLQADKCNAVFDNFRIVMPESYNRKNLFKFDEIPSVYEPNTQIVNPATVLTPLQSLDQFEDYATRRPATLILKVNNDLEVVNDNGEALDTLYKILIEMNGKYIPAFRVEDEENALIIAGKLKAWGIIDTFFISTDENVIKSARSSYNLIRGVLDLSERQITSNADLDKVRQDVNKAQSVAVILSPSQINKEKVNYLQNRLVTVWSLAFDTDEAMKRVVLSGINGLLTDDPMSVYDFYETFTTISHLREVFIIAHRGLHNGANASAGPENSVEVALQAYENGAKILETDIHLTSDGKIVIMHDDTTLRTANQNYTIAYATLAQLESLTLKDTSNTGKIFNIPSFERYLDAFVDKDVVLFVEVKPTNKTLLEKARDLVIDKGMENKVVFITFSAKDIKDMPSVWPAMSNGYLTSTLLYSSNYAVNMRNVLTNIVPLGSTLNPKEDSLTADVIRGLAHRGITVWPWTIDDTNRQAELYNSGVGGITTNKPDNFKNAYLFLNYQSLNYPGVKGRRLALNGTLSSMSGAITGHEVEVIFITNEANAEFDNHGVLTSAQNAGRVVFFTKVTTKLPNGEDITLYSDVMAIDITNPGGDDNSEKTIWQKPWIYIIGASVIAAVSGTVWFILIKRKK